MERIAPETQVRIGEAVKLRDYVARLRVDLEALRARSVALRRDGSTARTGTPAGATSEPAPPGTGNDA